MKIITDLAAKITGRKCSTCRHNVNGRCCHPNGKMFLRCWQNITRPGYEERTMAETLTPEEYAQLRKIKAALQEAEDTAHGGGLLEE